MSQFSFIDDLSGKSLFKRWLGIISFTLIYFLMIRPLRVYFVDILFALLDPLILEIEIAALKKSATTIILMVSEQAVQNSQKIYEYTYAPTFNSFFLLGISGLWYINQDIYTLKYLIYIHLFGWLFSSLFLVYGLVLDVDFWIGSDLITVYLVPVASMALVAIIFSNSLLKKPNN
ncbi:MAG: hypothetical protein CL672_00010 [Balneola sp.]|nr:hypothetical protein [Balneola sp.]|tara:strand:- start:1259 stop:1783 length:525 start_codon:yes stop_codon:yes gene_type:complete